MDKVENVLGMDCSNPEQEISQELLESPNFTYMQHDKIKLPFEDNKFDVVQISNTLHHINKTELSERIGELYRVLKDDGLFILVEGIRDKMDSASRTQNYLHIVRAFLDRENGISHYPQFWQTDIKHILDELEFEIFNEYSITLRRDDFKDKTNLDRICVFINELKEKCRKTNQNIKAIKAFESIQKRMYRTGYSGTPIFVSIRQKKSAPGRMAG
jgi:ubiquinone/menaquinone biosynthesis C-methylase UbiE